MSDQHKAVAGAAFYILALAAQVSGYSNHLVAWLLAFAGTGLLAVPAWHWVKNLAGRRRPATSDVIVKNMTIVFDENGPTEMYARFSLLNRGNTATVRNWKLSFSFAGETIPVPDARHFSAGAPFYDDQRSGSGYLIPHIDTLTVRPLEQGGFREHCQLTFTIPDQNAKILYGKPGARWVLTAEDTWDRQIRGTYVMQQ
ncbi:MAG TPA: hypothetical protein VJ750_06915 [Rhizomicrobium sp.]|nr:hypothetical protein [Rhizomicrobium sp.]